MMIVNLKNLGLASLTALAVTICAPALADRDDLRAIAEAKITLIEAIKHAQAAQPGTVIEASIDDDSFKPEFEVTLTRDGEIYDVRVNAETGEVLGVRKDKIDG